ncbi:MAG TPA: nitroreductase/quinone reductase family protein [Candidatus Acidoferrales bacterium]|jgi:deazaflavin-dependent oxidoreductase (nitroreductase family)|nr:nitroreductase/quinone reductase family protein [Candidatus Acidoferrales bacterium]
MADSSWEESLIADVRANGGRPSQGPLAGHPLLLMWSIGAKSGEERRSILTYSTDGDDLVVAGTKSGAPVDPFWVANVAAHPRVRVEAANDTYDADATVYADGPERDRLWAQHKAALPWFAKYEEQVTTRTIPVVRLRRVGA